jgi:hypothetical protein
MKKHVTAVVAAALMATVIIPTESYAIVPPPPHPPVVVTGGGGAGGGAAGGIIGVAAFLVTYDLIRRTTCSGDFLYLGGPGFTTPINAGTGNVMIPRQCKILHKKRRVVLRAKG